MGKVMDEEFEQKEFDITVSYNTTVVAESYEAYEEYLSWGESDKTWSQWIRQAWKECGIDDFGYDSETLIFR